MNFKTLVWLRVVIHQWSNVVSLSQAFDEGTARDKPFGADSQALGDSRALAR